MGGKDIALHVIGKLGVEGALYAALEFTGPTIKSLSMDGRFTLCNLAIEAGAKTGLIPPDEPTVKFMATFPHLTFDRVVSDRDAEDVAEHTFDISALTPQVAKPYLPSNVAPVNEVRGVKVDQVVIGSCTNGRMRDFWLAAEAMKGRKAHPNTRLLILPSTQRIVMDLIDSGLARKFTEAGAVISPPTCGPCIGVNRDLYLLQKKLLTVLFTET